MRTAEENEQRATIANSAQPSASHLCPEGDVRVRHYSLPSPQSATVVACNFCFVLARPDQRIIDPVAVKRQERGRELRPPAELGRKSIVCLSPGAVIASILLSRRNLHRNPLGAADSPAARGQLAYDPTVTRREYSRCDDEKHAPPRF